MNEIKNYCELENFWIQQEKDFFERMDNVLRKSGMDLEKESEKIHLLKECLGNKMIRYSLRLADEMNCGGLTYKKVRSVFARLEVRLRSEVNEFIGNWLNDGAW